jgi:hypothetical protein
MTIKKRSLADLAQAFQKKTGGENSDQSWKLFYPFWKMADDTTAIVRFLPDADEDNPMGFLVEKLEHELVINGRKTKVACLSMHGEDCPICNLSRQYYDKTSDIYNEALGQKFYKKRSYVGQVVVVESPIEHDQAQVVKLIDFGPKIFKQIQAAFQSGDLESEPFDLEQGYNFRIKKTKSGQFSDYGTSSFAPKQTALDANLIASLNLFDLKQYRGAKLSASELEAMLTAHQNGSSFDAPAETTTEAAPAQAPAAASAAVTPAAPATQAEAPVAAGPKLSVVEQLRARAAAAKAAAAQG